MHYISRAFKFSMVVGIIETCFLENLAYAPDSKNSQYFFSRIQKLHEYIICPCRCFRVEYLYNVSNNGKLIDVKNYVLIELVILLVQPEMPESELRILAPKALFYIYFKTRNSQSFQTYLVIAPIEPFQTTTNIVYEINATSISESYHLLVEYQFTYYTASSFYRHLK